MNTMSESAAQTGNRAEALLSELRRRRAELGDQHKELAGLLKQTSAEIDKAGQRTREATGQLKQVESRLEGTSHYDLKRAYTAAQEAQMRQFMMQTQLEQLRNRLTALDSSDELLRQLIGITEEIASSSEAEEDKVGMSGGQPQPGATRQGLDGAAMTFQGIELAMQRVSRQLQDEIAQSLSDLILRAEVCERLVEMDKQKAKNEVIRLKQAGAIALKSTRQLVQDLRPPALEESGLGQALRRYAESLKASGKLEVDLQVMGAEARMPRPVEVAAFRIVQEALANVAAHSGTKRAELRVRYELKNATITVADDGSGFDVRAAMESAREKEGSGLLDMYTRAELVGATLEISSTPGSGCTISLYLPN